MATHTALLIGFIAGVLVVTGYFYMWPQRSGRTTPGTVRMVLPTNGRQERQFAELPPATSESVSPPASASDHPFLRGVVQLDRLIAEAMAPMTEIERKVRE
jgi:hypothetical protein